MAQVVDMTPEEIKETFNQKSAMWARLMKRIDVTGKPINSKTASNASETCQKLGSAELAEFGYVKHICEKCINPQGVGDDLEQKRYVQARINDLEDILIKQYEKNPSSITGKPPTKTDFNNTDFKSKPVSPVQESLEEVIELKKQVDEVNSRLEEQRGFNKTLLGLHEDNKKAIADLQAKVDGLAGSN